MAIKKSVINEVELDDSFTIYVQAIGSKANISFDGPNSQYSHWITLDELNKLAGVIKLTIKEVTSE